MSIAYTYKIVAVDAQARCMEVVYEAEGHPVQHVGARLPFEGESLEDVIAMFAPVRHWELLKTPVVVPEVGVTGAITPIPIATAEPPVVTEAAKYRDLIDLNG